VIKTCTQDTRNKKLKDLKDQDLEDKKGVFSLILLSCSQRQYPIHPVFVTIHIPLCRPYWTQFFYAGSQAVRPGNLHKRIESSKDDIVLRKRS
jgi:hypothetical protein